MSEEGWCTCTKTFPFGYNSSGCPVHGKSSMSISIEDDLVEDLQRERDRARHLAKHLFMMIPEEIWKNSGGDDGQGHYEGFYRADQIEQEIKMWDEDE